MTDSRDRVVLALSHKESDRVPLDLGGSVVTGMHVSTVYAVRQALELDPPNTPVKVVEPYQMLGEIAPDLRKALGVDVVRLDNGFTMFGFRNEKWKPWKLFDSTPVLVPEKFNTEPDEKGDILMFPEGDLDASPCARMPEGGFYFDAVERQKPIDWQNLDVEENLEEFSLIDRETLRRLEKDTNHLYMQTDMAIFANFGGTGFGDIALIPGLSLKNPRGIRGIKEWYMCHIRCPRYMIKVFEKQCEFALENLGRIYKSLGNRITVVFVSGTDFGGQKGSLISNQNYRKLYKPFHKRINKWIHEHTNWKTFIHSCGSVESLIGDFIEAEFDILNPVQTSAFNMQPELLKAKFGDKISFWGGGIDTQRTLPFGTADDVQIEVYHRIKTFAKKGGFVFNTIHNVQPRVPVNNVLSMYRAVREKGVYPI